MADTCKICKFWKPRFYQVGQCARELAAHSKIWSSRDDAVIVTAASFSCSEYEQITDTERETV